MTDTAEALADIPEKVNVLTGAMAPVRFRVTDVIFNIGAAVGALQSKEKKCLSCDERRDL